MKYIAFYVKTVSGVDIWKIVSDNESFFSDFSIGHSKTQIEEFYNN